MIKRLNLNDVKIDEETFDLICDFYNKLDQDDIAHIYLSTLGGYSYISDEIIHILSEEGHRTVLYGSYRLFSSGFNIFFMAQCMKVLMDGCIGMLHLPAKCVERDVNNNIIHEEDVIYDKEGRKAMLKVQKRVADVCGVTEKEWKEALDGQDVYFSHKRMRKMLEKLCK